MDIIKIRYIAEMQYSKIMESGDDPSDCIGFEFNGQWIINPWIDASARFDMNTEEAIKYYGERNIVRFCEEVYNKHHSIEVPKEYAIAHPEELGVVFWPSWITDWTSEVHPAHIEHMENDTYIFEDDILLDSCIKEDAEMLVKEYAAQYAEDNCPPSPNTYSIFERS